MKTRSKSKRVAESQLGSEAKKARTSSAENESIHSEEEMASTSDTDLEQVVVRGAQTKSRVSIGGGGASTSDDRGRAAVGPQVEHVSAYTLFEELIYSSLEGEGLSNAAQVLVDNFKCLPLNEVAIEEISEHAAAAEDLISREERKAVTRTLRGTNYLTQTDNHHLLNQLVAERLNSSTDEAEKSKLAQIQQGLERIAQSDTSLIKEALKLANRAHLSRVTAQIMDGCIFGANKMDHACFPTEGVPANPNTGSERAAKNNLKLLSDFLEDLKEIKAATDVDRKEKIADLLENGKALNKLRDTWGVNVNQTLIDNLRHC